MAAESKSAVAGLLAAAATITLNEFNMIVAAGVGVCALVVGAPKALAAIRVHYLPAAKRLLSKKK